MKSTRFKKVNKPAGLLTLFFSLTIIWQSCSGPEASNENYARPAMPVEVAQANAREVADRFDAVGTFESDEAVTIVSEIDATVMSLPFEEGTKIKAGQVIARLDDAQLAAEVAKAEAVLEQNKAIYGRTKSIVGQNAGTPQDLDNALANLKVAEANLALAKARFEKTRIVSPFDGRIGARHVSVGTFLRSGQEIARVANLDNIRVSFSAPESYLAQLQRGAEVEVSMPAFPEKRVKGKIIAIEPMVDAATRNGQVVARVPNPGHGFLPGMSATISAILSKRASAITIPNEAVFANGGQSFVYVVQPDSTVSQAPVTLGTQFSDVVEVTDGLENGVTVVRAGHQKIFPGAKVMPINSRQAASN